MLPLTGLFGTIERRLPEPKPKFVKPDQRAFTAPPQTPQLAQLVFTMLVEYFEDRDSLDPKREAIEFMRSHAGATIVVPILPTVERIALEEQVVRAVDRDPSQKTTIRLSQISNQPRRHISKTYRRVTGISIEQRGREMKCRHPRFSRYAWPYRV